MTLRKHPQSEEITFICNNCGDKLPTQEDHFPAALEVLKKEGWIARKSGKDWEHYCDCCKEDYDA